MSDALVGAELNCSPPLQSGVAVSRMVEPKVEAAGIEPAFSESPNLRYAGLSYDEIGIRTAALADGEGHFQIGKINGHKPGGGNFNCYFRVKMRDDDREFLNMMCAVTTLGHVGSQNETRQDGHNRQPCAVWSVGSKHQCLQLVALLDEFPLWSKKARDYHIWRKAVLYWNDPYVKKNGRIYWEPMGEFRERLMAVRKYKTPAQFAA